MAPPISSLAIGRLPEVPAHLAAAGSALFFAWYVAQSAYFQSALQFVAPLIVVMVVHLGWLAAKRGLDPGFSRIILKRSALTAALMAAALLGFTLLAPMPAQANDFDPVIDILMVAFCAAIITCVVCVCGLVVYAIYLGFRWLLRRYRKTDDDRLFDFASVAITLCALGIASIEGLSSPLSFEKTGRSTASFTVDAPPTEVWTAMQTATSPAFPLPGMLSVFPQPVSVVKDEGTKLGAYRTVRFEGREGAGLLKLRVVERTDQDAVFEVLSDTTPYAGWIGYRTLTYSVTAIAGEKARLDVTLIYERLLSPAWFFGPAMKSAAHMAMGVLARDVKARAESDTVTGASM